MMRLFKITLITLVIYLVSIPLLSCGSASDSASLSENQVVTVQRGNLTIDITGVGNLALSRTEDLAFDIPSTFSKTSPITVEEVLVEAGDSVQEGQELVKLDTLEWDKYLKTLETELVAAQRDLAKAERQITTKELAVRQAQLNLQTAEDDLDQIADVKAIQDQIDDAEAILKAAKMALSGEIAGAGNPTYWLQQIAYWTEKRAEAQSILREILSGSSVDVSSDVALQVAKGVLKVEQSQMQLEDAQIAVEDARLAKEDAEQAVKDAQSDLDEAKSLSPVIKAPFDGFITKVNVLGGDEVKKGTVAVTIADPTKFEAEVMVSEMDILKVKLGGNASVQVDAMPGLSLSANVTHISPTATIQSGVVNYKVKVELTSLQPVPTQTQGGTAATGNVTAGAPSGRSGQAFSSGNLTQEQINQMIQQRQQASAGQSGGQSSQTTSTITGEVQLAEGMTVTVSIMTAQRNDVLLVPTKAIISRGSETLVQVLKDGVTEERSIQTGISDWQFTEVTEGLTEGEQIIVPEGTATTTTTSQQRPPGGIMIPGMGPR